MPDDSSKFHVTEMRKTFHNLQIKLSTHQIERFHFIMLTASSCHSQWNWTWLMVWNC